MNGLPHSAVDHALAIAVGASIIAGALIYIRWWRAGQPEGEQHDLAAGCAVGVVIGVLFVCVLITIQWWIGRWP